MDQLTGVIPGDGDDKVYVAHGGAVAFYHTGEDTIRFREGVPKAIISSQPNYLFADSTAHIYGFDGGYASSGGVGFVAMATDERAGIPEHTADISVRAVFEDGTLRYETSNIIGSNIAGRTTATILRDEIRAAAERGFDVEAGDTFTRTLIFHDRDDYVANEEEISGFPKYTQHRRWRVPDDLPDSLALGVAEGDLFYDGDKFKVASSWFDSSGSPTFEWVLHPRLATVSTSSSELSQRQSSGYLFELEDYVIDGEEKSFRAVFVDTAAQISRLNADPNSLSPHVTDYGDYAPYYREAQVVIVNAPESSSVATLELNYRSYVYTTGENAGRGNVSSRPHHIFAKAPDGNSDDGNGYIASFVLGEGSDFVYFEGDAGSGSSASTFLLHGGDDTLLWNVTGSLTGNEEVDVGDGDDVVVIYGGTFGGATSTRETATTRLFFIRVTRARRHWARVTTRCS